MASVELKNWYKLLLTEICPGHIEHEHSWDSAIYRVEHQTLPVKFLLNFYCMLQDMNLKIGTDNPLVLSYDMIKA